MSGRGRKGIDNKLSHRLRLSTVALYEYCSSVGSGTLYSNICYLLKRTIAGMAYALRRHLTKNLPQIPKNTAFARKSKNHFLKSDLLMKTHLTRNFDCDI